MKDSFNREINYLRVSVTDRCNLRCRYCMPAKGINTRKHRDILSYEDMLLTIRVCASMGINKIRLTGGEPMVRKGIIDFISRINEVDNIKEINLTTNGVFLSDTAEKLKDAGVKNINISLDSLKSSRYEYITRGGDLKQAIKGLFKAIETGFEKIKLNVVVIKGFNNDEIMDFINLAEDNPIHVRFIELMPIGEAVYLQERFVSADEIISQLGGLQEVDSDFGTGPAKYYSIKGFKGLIGFIDPISQCFCASCNRIRLTADGKLLPCLHSNREVDLKQALAAGDINKLMNAVSRTLKLKPESHNMNSSILSESERYMSQVGG